jgi:hypothetical protein
MEKEIRTAVSSLFKKLFWSGNAGMNMIATKPRTMVMIPSMI